MTRELMFPEFLEELEDAWETISGVVLKLLQSWALFGIPISCFIRLSRGGIAPTVKVQSLTTIISLEYGILNCNKKTTNVSLLMSANQHLVVLGIPY